MTYKRGLLALAFAALGFLAMPLYAEEEGAICCEYSSECPDGFPQCNIVGVDCSSTATGTQGYCMANKED